MSVYVDPLAQWGWRLGASCHLIADDLEELHAFAARLGMRRAWFQAGASTPHYDLTAKRRARAVEMGVVELNRSDFVVKLKAFRASCRAVKAPSDEG